MEKDRALYWIAISALLAFGATAGQPAAVVIGGCVAIFLAYEQLLKRTASSQPVVNVS